MTNVTDDLGQDAAKMINPPLKAPFPYFGGKL